MKNVSRINMESQATYQAKTQVKVFSIELPPRFDISNEDDAVIIQLSQSDVRELGQKKELLVIGFHIMRVEENRRYRLHRIQSPQVTSDYIKTKHIFLKATLPKGRFVIIPTTFK